MKPIELAINGAHDFVESVDQALQRGEIDEAQWYERMSSFFTAHYLAGDNPRSQSGYGGDDARWARARGLIADAIDRHGAFLDVGCASGYLMECMQRWCAEKGIRIEPYGIDISPELAALAESRLPQWANRIWTLNAFDFRPGRRFDFVRTGLEYVPTHRQRKYVAHLLENVTAPDGRLIIGAYNEARADAATKQQLVSSWGFKVSGQSEREHPDSRICYRVFWIDAKER